MNQPVARRRLRLGIVGGGSPTSIGPSHVAASRLDGQWDLVAGAFSRDPVASAGAADRYFVDPARAYASYREMARAEADRPDGIDAVTVCTHNDTHFEVADAFLAEGIHVICDKPLAVSIAQAQALVDHAASKDLLLAVTYTYSGYPMVRMAREMVADGRIGEVQSVQVEYVHQYLAGEPIGTTPYDPMLGDTLGVVAALGSHAFHMAEFVSGLKAEALAARLSGLRGPMDDHANMLLEFEGGVPGSLFVTSVSHGNANGLKFHLIGTEGTLSWHQEQPEVLQYCAAGTQTVALSRGGPQTSELVRAACRIPEGHPEGYLEAFANIYLAVARAIRDERTLPENGDFPDGPAGLRGVQFMSAALASTRAGSVFVPIGERV